MNISTGIFNSLSCVTPIEACCQSTHTGTGMEAGLWYFPDASEIPFGSLNLHYITRGASVVRLNRASLAVTTTGMYRCEVPVMGGTESVYVGLYPVGQGWLHEYKQYCVCVFTVKPSQVPLQSLMGYSLTGSICR